MRIMEVDFSPETQAKLNRVAQENGSDSAEYVQQLVEHYLDHDSWFRQKVNKGLEQLNSAQFLTHEEVGERIAKLFPA
jgi:predicted transcriptional regulator